MNERQCKLYLETLFSNIADGQYIELRPIKNKNDHKQFFFKKNERDKLLQKVRELDGKYHIFIGVLPRANKSGRDKDIEYFSTFWVDIDAKDFGGDKKKAYSNISNFALDPTMVIDSGNGYHVYWVLETPIKLTEDNKAKIKIMLKNLHIKTKADQTYDLARILRIPGTHNIKDPKNFKKVTTDPEKWTYSEIEGMNASAYYSLEDFENILYNEDDMKTDNISSSKKVDLDLCTFCRINTEEDLRKHVANDILLRAETTPDRYVNDRSTNDFWIALNMYNEGFNDKEVYNAFNLFASMGWSAGKKVVSDGDRYLLDYTLPNAKKRSATVEELSERLVQEESVVEKLNIVETMMPLLANQQDLIQEMYIKKIHNEIKGLTGVTIGKLRSKIYALKPKLDFMRFYAVNPNTGNYTFVPKKLGEYIKSKSDLFNLNDILYKYEDGVYKPDGLVYVKEEIQKLLGEKWKKAYREDTIAWILDDSYMDPEDPRLSQELLNVRNGMLDVRKDKLYPHDPKYLSRTQLNVTFDPNAFEPVVNKFMKDVFVDNDTIQVMWEHAGYTFLPQLELKKFLILTGHKDNGKSVWLNWLQDIIGDLNVSHEDLHSLSNNRFAMASLFGKTANVCADMESTALSQTGMIKQLTGGDTLRAELKFKSTFYFKNTAKMFFSCNVLPTILDYNHAFFSRVHVVYCPTRFVEGINADPDILNKLTTENAKSYWLNKALLGAKRLLKNKKFTYAIKIEQQVQAYMYSSDSSTEFASLVAGVHKDPRAYRGNANEKNYISKKDMYNYYISWCEDNAKHPQTTNKFSRRLEAEPNMWVSKRIKIGDQVRVVWCNLYDIDFALLDNLGNGMIRRH